MPKKKRLQPTKFGLEGCTARCSLNKANLGENRADLVHKWFESGLNDDEIEKTALDAGFRISHAAVGRHRRGHLVKPLDAGPEAEMGGLSDVQALEAIIKRGQQFIPTWRITPSEYFKALDLYYKLTKGSAFDDLMSSFAAAAQEIEEEDTKPKPDDPSVGDYDIDE